MTHRSLSVSRQFLGRIGAFAAVSGAGLVLDVVLFLIIVAIGVRAGFANLISATAAVSFVYFISVRRIFAYRGRFLFGLFAIYLAYQVVAVSAASWAVDWLVQQALNPGLAKGAILPATFSANYLFMSLLTRSRQSV